MATLITGKYMETTFQACIFTRGTSWGKSENTNNKKTPGVSTRQWLPPV